MATMLGVTGLRVEGLQIGPISLTGGWCLVAVFDGDIDPMLISQGYSNICRTTSTRNRDKPRPHRANSGKAMDGTD